MSPLFRALRLIFAADRWAMTKGAIASVTVLLMGVALLGLSGWFITATGLAGAAGIGIAFDVFRPSAGVRLLALGRSGARYAERLLTHDATLRALTRLRVIILEALETQPIAQLRRLRGAAQLTRMTADVDALDGVALRLVLPILAGVITHLASFAALWWLTTPMIATSILLGYGLGGLIVLTRTGLASFSPSIQAERDLQTLRRQTIGLFRGQREALLQGRLHSLSTQINTTEAALRDSLQTLDRIDRHAGFGLSVVVATVTALTIALPLGALSTDQIDPARAAIGIFVALALAETLLPLRRGFAELGRMRDAASRTLPDAPPPHANPTQSPAFTAPLGLSVHDLTLHRPDRMQPLLTGLSLHVAPGETLALHGPSGLGKSTLLDALAGLGPTDGIQIHGLPLSDWPEPDLRRQLTLLPQRAALIGGTIRENLALAMAVPDDSAMLDALEAVQLLDVVAPRGGLDMILGESGAGLSGGESRRLALARALLRKPAILLLDEPTEGLDDPLARRVLTGLRDALPDCAILMASHRQAELEFAHRQIDLKRYIPKTALL